MRKDDRATERSSDLAIGRSSERSSDRAIERPSKRPIEGPNNRATISNHLSVIYGSFMSQLAFYITHGC